MIDAQRLNNLKSWQQRYVDEKKYAGSSLLIHHRGAEVFFNSCGMRNLESGLTFTRDTAVRIYSMTKPITSVAIMMLVEQGLFHLDASLLEFLPEFSDMTALTPNARDLQDCEPCRSPTIHELLTHTSGFSYPFNPGVLPAAMAEEDLMFKPGQEPLANAVKRLAQLPMAFRPGSRWEYSVSIDVLGRIVEVVTGETLDTFLKTRVFEPLAMTDTGFRVPEATGDRLASLYTPLVGDAFDLNSAHAGSNPLRLTDQWQDSPFRDTNMFSGGGGLVSTIDDYMKFAEMLRCKGRGPGARLLSSSTVDFMTCNHLPGDIASMGPSSFAEQPMEGMGFGLGGAVVLDPARARCPGSIGDFSWGGMASTFFWIDPIQDLSVVFFTQLSPSSSYPSRAELKALVHAAIVDR